MADHPAAGRVGKVAVGASKERLDPAHQLPQAERLCEVVVGAELQADDLVDLLVPGGQHEDRRLRPRGAQPPEHLEPVHAGQADVEHDEVRGLVRGEVEAFLAGPRDRDLVALLLERVLDTARDRELVFDDQDGGSHVRDATPLSRRRRHVARNRGTGARWACASLRIRHAPARRYDASCGARPQRSFRAGPAPYERGPLP